VLAHSSSVEGHYLLGRALEACGDAAGARTERESAWREYSTSPRYKRRLDRLWAWRARPSRPATYALLLALALAATGLVARKVDLPSARAAAAQEQESELDP